MEWVRTLYADGEGPEDVDVEEMLAAVNAVADSATLKGAFVPDRQFRRRLRREMRKQRR
jgi:hypothetical protein